jgi:hypothetical protein
MTKQSNFCGGSLHWSHRKDIKTSDKSGCKILENGFWKWPSFKLGATVTSKVIIPSLRAMEFLVLEKPSLGEFPLTTQG